jgi:pimeloyl-ACP methyl ester carboxylesterase
MKRYLFIFTFLAANLVLGEENSQNNKPQPDASITPGIVYYLDGAGGGSLFTNWAPGVRKGLLQGGFKGEFQEFGWHTALGVLADQTSSVEYKRSKGKLLAGKIVAWKQAHPGRTVTLIGLSAGTAVTLYTLEALPETCKVETVILLGCSVSAGFNLSTALGRVEGNILVFTSDRDEILNSLVPMAGTADRQYVGSEVAGIMGFYRSIFSKDTNRALYEKVKNIPWSSRFERFDNYGGHTDGTNPRFVQHVLAPMIIAAANQRAELAKAETPAPVKVEALAAEKTSDKPGSPASSPIAKAD